MFFRHSCLWHSLLQYGRWHFSHLLLHAVPHTTQGPAGKEDMSGRPVLVIYDVCLCICFCNALTYGLLCSMLKFCLILLVFADRVRDHQGGQESTRPLLSTKQMHYGMHGCSKKLSKKMSAGTHVTTTCDHDTTWKTCNPMSDDTHVIARGHMMQPLDYIVFHVCSFACNVTCA